MTAAQMYQRYVFIGVILIIIILQLRRLLHPASEGQEDDHVVSENTLTQQANVFPFHIGRHKQPVPHCDDILFTYGISLKFNASYPRELENFEAELRDISQRTREEREGYSWQLPLEAAALRYLAALPWVRTICETGLNAGHSSFNWLTANPGARVYSFDLGAHRYTRLIAGYLTRTYTPRFTAVLGNSTQTIPAFRARHPHVRCDLIYVDGGHDYHVALSDIEEFRRMAARRNLLVFDDYPCGDCVKRGQGDPWDHAVQRGDVTKLYSCGFRWYPQAWGPRGYAVGTYTV